MIIVNIIIHNETKTSLLLFNQEDNVVRCDVTQEVNATTVGVDCSVTSFLLPAHTQVSPS